MLPEPASPLVRIIAAPSPIRRSASPRSRQPQTNGTRNANLSMWKCSSAGVSTSDSSMKSIPSASRICASTKCPMRALAMTGMVTAFWISWIFFTGDMRATPPSLRMSEGTRSSAITDAAPASSAILACSALVTSMMTPPLSISASPMCLRSAILSPFTSAMRGLLYIWRRSAFAGLRRSTVGRRTREFTPLRRSTVGRRTRDSYEWCGHTLDRTRARPPTRRAHHLAESPHALINLAAGHGGERQPQCALPAAVHPDRRARRVGHAALVRPREQRARVQSRRQGHQQREAALRLRPRHILGHAPLERCHQRVAAPPVLGGNARHVTIEQPPLAEAVHRRLDEGARVQVRELLGRAQPLGQRRGRHEPAKAQPGKEHLREGAEVERDPE